MGNASQRIVFLVYWYSLVHHHATNSGQPYAPNMSANPLTSGFPNLGVCCAFVLVPLTYGRVKDGNKAIPAFCSRVQGLNLEDEDLTVASGMLH